MAAGWTRHTPPVAVMNSNYERLEEDTPTPSRPGAYDPHVPAPAAAPVAAAAASPSAMAAPDKQHIPTAAAAPAGAVPTAVAVPMQSQAVPMDEGIIDLG